MEISSLNDMVNISHIYIYISKIYLCLNFYKLTNLLQLIDMCREWRIFYFAKNGLWIQSTSSSAMIILAILTTTTTTTTTLCNRWCSTSNGPRSFRPTTLGHRSSSKPPPPTLIGNLRTCRLILISMINRPSIIMFVLRLLHTRSNRITC